MKKFLVALILISSTQLFAQKQISLFEVSNNLLLEQHENNNYKAPKTDKKSVGLAILYSLILPGMGELYAGDYSLGKYLTIADGVFWGFAAGFNIYGNWQKDNYQSYAATQAGVSLDGKDDLYFATIADYVDVEQYNRIQELNRDFGERYGVESHYWNWGDNTNRREYRNMWTSSESAYNNVRFAVGALIVNRLVSAINAVRLVARYNKNLDEEMSWNVSVGIDNKPNLPTSLNLNFNTSF